MKFEKDTSGIKRYIAFDIHKDGAGGWTKRAAGVGHAAASGRDIGADPKVDANAVELARLQRENKRLQEKLERAEIIIDVHTCPGGRCQGKKLRGCLEYP